jgi:hypothetical protein
MIYVRKLIWDRWNIQHISRHHVSDDEIEEICHSNPLVLQGQKKKRLVVIGNTAEDRMLTIILESQGQGSYYPITAFPSDDSDIKLYKHLRGGQI